MARRASAPRVIGEKLGFNTDAMRLAQNGNIKLDIDRFEKRKVARRMFSVFDQLATNGRTVGGVVVDGKLCGGVVSLPTLTKEEAVRANSMFSLYAVWKGMAGAPDGEDVGYVQCSRSEPELLTDRMRIAGDAWIAITGNMKLRNVALLTALCHDMLLSDGAVVDIGAGKPRVRWRIIVETVDGVKDRDCQRDCIKRACKDLISAIDKARKSGHVFFSI